MKITSQPHMCEISPPQPRINRHSLTSLGDNPSHQKVVLTSLKLQVDFTRAKEEKDFCFGRLDFCFGTALTLFDLGLFDLV